MRHNRLFTWLVLGGSLAFLAGCDSDAPTALDEGSQGDSFASLSLLNGTAPMCETITFDDMDNAFVHGSNVTSLMTQYLGTLSVTVEPYPDESTDQARTYDTSGDWGTFDDDLEYPPGGVCADCAAYGLKNVLIIQQLGASQPANDSRTGGRITFDGFSGGEYYIESFMALDDDTGQLFQARVDGTTLLAPQSVSVGNGSVQTVTITTPHTFTDKFSIEYEGSGATDNIVICGIETERGEDGCTPGYWKQPHHFGNWAVPQTTVFGDIFSACYDASIPDYKYIPLQNPESGNLCTTTFLDALSLRGGGVNALARHGVAAWLNAASPDVDYYWTTGEVEDLVNEALTQGGVNMVKDQLAEMNERYCPLGRAELPS